MGSNPPQDDGFHDLQPEMDVTDSLSPSNSNEYPALAGEVKGGLRAALVRLPIYVPHGKSI